MGKITSKHSTIKKQNERQETSDTNMLMIDPVTAISNYPTGG